MNKLPNDFNPTANKTINLNVNKNNITIIIATYNENIDWSKNFLNVIIYN